MEKNKPMENQLMRKLEWQCRRGMLELDVILAPFLAQHFSALDAKQQAAFVELLDQADPDLYTWIMGFGDCPHQHLQPILQSIRSKISV